MEKQPEGYIAVNIPQVEYLMLRNFCDQHNLELVDFLMMTALEPVIEFKKKEAKTLEEMTKKYNVGKEISS